VHEPLLHLPNRKLKSVDNPFSARLDEHESQSAPEDDSVQEQVADSMGNFVDQHRQLDRAESAQEPIGE
jgi:hypothetical protein